MELISGRVSGLVVVASIVNYLFICFQAPKKKNQPDPLLDSYQVPLVHICGAWFSPQPSHAT